MSNQAGKVLGTWKQTSPGVHHNSIAAYHIVRWLVVDRIITYLVQIASK